MRTNASAARNRPSRRDFAFGLAAAGLALQTFIRPRAAAAAEEAVYFGWAGYDVPDIFPSYLEKYGAPPVFSVFADEAEAFLKMQSGYTPDVAHPCQYNTGRWRDADLLQAIDTSRLKNWEDVIPELKELEGTRFDGEQWFMPFDWGEISVLYRTDLVDLDEESIGLMWDPRYKDRIAILDIAEDVVSLTAMYAGYDPYKMTPEQMQRVEDLLNEQKALARFYSADMTAISQALASGEVVAAYSWGPGVASLKSEGIPVKFMRPKEGRLTWVCGLVLLKNALHPDKVYDLLDAMLDPRAGKYMIEVNGTGHANTKSFDLVSDDTLAQVELSRDASGILGSGVFLEDFHNRDDVIKMYERVKTGL